MAKRYTKQKLAEILGVSEGLLVMEANIARLVPQYEKTDGTVKRIYTEADREAIVKSRNRRGLETPPVK